MRESAFLPLHRRQMIRLIGGAGAAMWPDVIVAPETGAALAADEVIE
jgi:hypothetical protein